MKIAIDGRFWGLENTGLGRYTIGLITALSLIDKKNEYLILLRQKWFSQFDKLKLGKNFRPILAEAVHYSLKEQIIIPKILREIKPDLLHVLHFNAPLGYRGKMVVTIHDLITQFSMGAQATTLPRYKYLMKWYAHNFVLRNAVKRSATILAPSLFTKQEIIKKYAINDEKVVVTYEGIDAVYWQKSQKFNKQKYGIGNSQYIVYTGNVYPHKNITNLIDGLAEFNSRTRVPYHLLVVCSRSVFANRLKKIVNEKNMNEYVHFLGFIEDNELREIYRNCQAFVTPSKLEGFGLPGLEAMASGTLVIAAKASCLPEIYGSHAIYFNPDKPEDLAIKLRAVDTMSQTMRQKTINEAKDYATTFSWKHLAQKTINQYSKLGV